jgi:hypothetical protein
VTVANAIAARPVGSECGNSNCGQRAVDIKPRSQAGRIIASASKPIDNAAASLA